MAGTAAAETTEDGDESPPFGLPDELILMVISFLTQKRDLFSLYLVNRRFLQLANDDTIWRQLFAETYPELDGRRLVGTRWKDRLRLVRACWHSGQFKVRRRLATSNRFGGVRFIHYDDDNPDLIVGGSIRGQIVIWNCGQPAAAKADEEEVEYIDAHSEWVRCVIRRGDTLFSASSDQRVKIWSLSTKKLVHAFTDHTNQVNLVKLIPDPAGTTATSTSLLSASDDQSIKQWDIERGLCVRTFNGQDYTHQSGWILGMDCDARTVVGAGNSHNIVVWDLRTGMPERIIENNGVIRFLQFRGDTLALGGDSPMQIWDLRTYEMVRKLANKGTAWTLQICGSRLLSGGDEPQVNQYNIDTGELQFTLTDPAPDEASVQSLQASAARIVTGSLAGWINVFEPSLHSLEE